jgi:hypothetical protein
MSNNCFNLIIPFGMRIAPKERNDDYNFHANPYGPELQVKQMLDNNLNLPGADRVACPGINSDLFLPVRSKHFSIKEHKKAFSGSGERFLDLSWKCLSIQRAMRGMLFSAAFFACVGRLIGYTIYSDELARTWF